MSVRPSRYRFSVDDYHKMAEAGILRESDRVELIRGEIIEKAKISSQHASVVTRISSHFHQVFREKYTLSVQNPINIGDTSEPEPDLAICQWSENYYAHRHPIESEVLLVIEVADSTLEYDLTLKKTLYAEAGIPEYWVVDVKEKQVHRFRNPENGDYLKSEMLAGEDEISLPGGASLSLKNILI